MPGFCARLVTIEPSPPLRNRRIATARILDLDGGMVEVGPVAADLGDLVAHEPAQQVEHVGRLVDEHAAALGVPAAAPGVGLVIATGRASYTS